MLFVEWLNYSCYFIVSAIKIHKFGFTLISFWIIEEKLKEYREELEQYKNSTKVSETAHIDKR